MAISDIQQTGATALAQAQEVRTKTLEAKAQVEAKDKQVKEAAEKAKKIKGDVEKAKKRAKEKADELKKAATDAKSFLKDQSNVSSSGLKVLLLSVILPVVTKFINNDKVINKVLDTLFNQVTKNLQSQGRVDINNGKIVFTPKYPGDYSKYKVNFDNKVNSLKQTITTLYNLLGVLSTLLKVAKAGVAALQIQLIIQEKRLQIQAIASAAELATPSPTKPITAKYQVDFNTFVATKKEKEDKIVLYTALISYIDAMLKICRSMLNKIQTRLNQLSFTIIQQSTQSSTNNILANTVTNQTSQLDLSEEFISNDGTKTYTIKTITTPSGALQAVAYDSFSMMKITQTAPSKTRKADELIDELKQILG
jgi:hypothetical protein